MKKKVLIILVILGIIQTVLWGFNILRFYNYPTEANEPNLKQGSKFIWSSLVKPERMDFICFRVKSDTSNYEVAMRLVGLPNDVLEIKNGSLYVNNRNLDEGINLRRPYKYHKDYFDSIITPKVENVQFYNLYTTDSILAFMDDNVIKANNFDIQPRVLGLNESDELIKSKYDQDWNIDNFGPLTIPREKYFVMGDNRGNSFDSRYTGFISEEDILGTIIYIYWQ